jgi:hypothetical protein
VFRKALALATVRCVEISLLNSVTDSDFVFLFLYDIVPKAPKKKPKKRVKISRRLCLSSSSEEDDKSVVEQGDAIMPTPPRAPVKKKKVVPVRELSFDLKRQLRDQSGGKKPWIEISAKKEHMVVKFFYPGGNDLVTKTRKVAYPKPGHPLILSDD